ncbi:MAG: primosomal protein N' [candidate division Zixibacteria bacterium]|nr:primosomal protein N' [candidate division Zixibacteria bacterium]
MFAQVALSLPLSEPFVYRIPSHLEGKMDLGFRVLVPLRKRIVTGFVVGLTATANIPNVKEIKDFLDPYPLFSGEMLELTKWVSDYYLCSWGEALRTALPSELMLKSEMYVKTRVKGQGARGKEDSASKFSARQKRILDVLADGEERKLSWLARTLKAKGLYAELYDLSKKGEIEIDERLGRPGVGIIYEKMVRMKNFDNTSENLELLQSAISAMKKKSPAQANCLKLLLENGGELSWKKLTGQYKISTNSLKGLEKKGVIELVAVEKIREGDWALDLPETQPVSLNKGQREILVEIRKALGETKYSPFLIHGITGSGKTQIYIKAIREVLKDGKQALILVPEISLTPQIISRFKANFGEKVGCLHSRLSAGERFDTWRRVRSGELSIVVGARSAVFSPFQNLGMIVVDEEHDPSYKQDDPTPRYNARDVAVMRAKLNEAVVILGSATPSLESYYNAQSGKYVLCQLKERVAKQKLPNVKIVDLTQERKEGNRNFLSSRLRTLLQDRMDNREQALLFLNRRGFSTFVKCQDCGHIEKCPHCDITLTFHRTDFSLRCHYCNYQKKAPNLCPNCQGHRFMYKGAGTQKIEEELKEHLPKALMERMDLDTTVKKGAHKKLLSDFGKKKFGILLGTQMITKGLDFPDVTLVGVISADTGLDLPDFRSKERTFQLLTQVAGRAGRGTLEGEVIVQTYYPEDWTIKLAASHDFEEFYLKELEQRRELGYPPFNHLILVVFSGKSLRKVTSCAQNFSSTLKRRIKSGRQKRAEILGPAPAPLSKIKNQYRWQLLIKTKSINSISSLIRKILEGEKNAKKKEAVRITVNVDPMDML